MKYIHRFTVSAPLADLVLFHKQSASMGAITPPPLVVQVHRAPALLVEGDEMEFSLWFGPFPIRWLACIEQVTPTSFVDRQVRGPFARWVHQHTFVPLTGDTTVVLDEVEADLSPQWFWRLLGLGMWLNLPVLFAFRAWKTQRLLGRTQVSQSHTVHHKA